MQKFNTKPKSFDFESLFYAVSEVQTRQKQVGIDHVPVSPIFLQSIFLFIFSTSAISLHYNPGSSDSNC